MFEILILQQQATFIKPSYEEMISAGLTMGFIGYLVTFITLTILASIIWIVSKAIPPSKSPPKVTPTIPREVIAAAVAAVRTHILSKTKKKLRITPPRPKYLKWRGLGWFRSARLSHMETLDTYESERKKRKGGLQ